MQCINKSSAGVAWPMFDALASSVSSFFGGFRGGGLSVSCSMCYETVHCSSQVSLHTWNDNTDYWQTCYHTHIKVLLSTQKRINVLKYQTFISNEEQIYE